MVLLRVLGWLLLLLGLVLLGRDLLVWYDTGTFTPLALDQFWADLDHASLDGFEAVMERNLAPWAWSGIVENALALWAAPVLAAVGVVLLWLGRRRHDRAAIHHRRR